MAKYTGVVLVKLDGQTVRTKEGAKLDAGGYERESQDFDGLAGSGYSEKPKASTLTFDVAHASDTDLAILNSPNVTCIFECDSGVSYVIREAFSNDTVEISDAGGGASCKFMGPPAEKL